MRLRDIIDKLRFGDSTKKNVNILNKLIEQVNNNTEHIFLPDNETLRVIKLYGEDRLSANLEIVTLKQFMSLNNGQTVTLDNGREIVFDEKCFYIITDDNGNAVVNNLYSRDDYGMIRGWAELLLTDESEDAVPTLKYLYAHHPIDGPVSGHYLYTCRVTKMSNDFIEIEATDLYTGYNYVTVKRDGEWTDWVPSTIEYITARGDIHFYISPDGADLDGDGTIERPFATVQYAISQLPRIRGEFTYYIHLESGTYYGFTLDGMDVEICGFADDKMTTISFSGSVNIINGATLNVNNEISTFGIALTSNAGSVLNIKKNASVYIAGSLLIASPQNEPTNTRTGIMVSDSSHLTVNKSLVISGCKTSIECTTSSKMFVDALTVSTSSTAVVVNSNAEFAYNSLKCFDVKRQTMSLNGGTISRGSQVDNRRCVVGDITGKASENNPLTYKVASIDITTPGRLVTSTFRICNSSKDIDQYGTLTVKLELSTDGIKATQSTIYWEYASQGIINSNENSKFYLMYRILDSKLHADIYVDVTVPWLSYLVECVNENQAFTSTPDPIEQWVLNQDIYSNTPSNNDISDIDVRINPIIRGYQINEEYIEWLNISMGKKSIPIYDESAPVIDFNSSIYTYETNVSSTQTHYFTIKECVDLSYEMNVSTEYQPNSMASLVPYLLQGLVCIEKWSHDTGYRDVVDYNKYMSCVRDETGLIKNNLSLSPGSYRITFRCVSNSSYYTASASVMINMYPIFFDNSIPGVIPYPHARNAEKSITLSSTGGEDSYFDHEQHVDILAFSLGNNQKGKITIGVSTSVNSLNIDEYDITADIIVTKKSLSGDVIIDNIYIPVSTVYRGQDGVVNEIDINDPGQYTIEAVYTAYNTRVNTAIFTSVFIK